MIHRRSFLTLGAFLGGSLAAPGLATIARAACGSVDALPSVSRGFAGGLETRNGTNIAYYPFRVCSSAGGTWLRSGEEGSVGGVRIAWLPNGVEFSLQSELNVAACTDGTTCASDSPRLRPLTMGHAWGYAERYPNLRVGAVPAPTQEPGWVAMRDLEFVGYVPHTRRRGPTCSDIEVHANPDDGTPISANARSSTNLPANCRRANPSCGSVNSCTEGDTDCDSADGVTYDFRDAPVPAMVLGGYKDLPFVVNDRSPDMTRGDDMPLSLLYVAPGSNSKCYVRAGDEVNVLWRRTANVPNPEGPATTAVWYGVELLSSQSPILAPVGVRGWLLAYSELDAMNSGRGQFVTSVL